MNSSTSLIVDGDGGGGGGANTGDESSASSSLPTETTNQPDTQQAHEDANLSRRRRADDPTGSSGSSSNNNDDDDSELVVQDDDMVAVNQKESPSTPPRLSPLKGDEGDVSASTVVITSSQIIENENDHDRGVQSMIMTESTTATTTADATVADVGDDEACNKSNATDKSNAISDEDKEYEIPNFDASASVMGKSIEPELAVKADQLKADLEEATTATSIIEEKKEEAKVRGIEDETYQEVLGNKSLLKKITEYGDQTLSEFSRRPMNGQMVTISYEAYLKDSDPLKLVDHNDSLSFILGDGDVISGLDMVVSLMDKNEKCEMIVESRHAYGTLGKQPDIPPNATLLYKIHLKDFNDVTDMNIMSPVERLSLADAKKLRGNYQYNRQDFHLAVYSYKKGLAYFNEENLRGDELDEDLKKFADLAQALSMNLALSYYKLGQCREALEALDQVIRVNGSHVKALYIKGKILVQIGESEEAIKALNQSLQLDPSNADVKKELTKAQAKHKIQYENEKKMYKKMISAVSKTEEELEKLKRASAVGKKASSSYLPYLVTGLTVAVASIGIAWFARYKNII